MFKDYKKYIEQLNRELRQQGFDLELDISSIERGSFGKITTVLDLFFVVNNSLKEGGSRSVFIGKYTENAISYLKDKLRDDYTREWNAKKDDLVKQPANAGKIEKVATLLSDDNIQGFMEKIGLSYENNEELIQTEEDESNISKTLGNLSSFGGGIFSYLGNESGLSDIEGDDEESESDDDEDDFYGDDDEDSPGESGTLEESEDDLDNELSFIGDDDEEDYEDDFYGDSIDESDDSVDESDDEEDYEDDFYNDEDDLVDESDDDEEDYEDDFYNDEDEDDEDEDSMDESEEEDDFYKDDEDEDNLDEDEEEDYEDDFYDDEDDSVNESEDEEDYEDDFYGDEDEDLDEDDEEEEEDDFYDDEDLDEDSTDESEDEEDYDDDFYDDEDDSIDEEDIDEEDEEEDDFYGDEDEEDEPTEDDEEDDDFYDDVEDDDDIPSITDFMTSDVGKDLSSMKPPSPESGGIPVEAPKPDPMADALVKGVNKTFGFGVNIINKKLRKYGGTEK